MRVLIDTNVLLRWYWSTEAVSAAARAVIEDAANEILVGVVSLYEIGNKNRLGKLAVHVSDIELAAEEGGFTFLTFLVIGRGPCPPRCHGTIGIPRTG